PSRSSLSPDEPAVGPFAFKLPQAPPPPQGRITSSAVSPSASSSRSAGRTSQVHGRTLIRIESADVFLGRKPVLRGIHLEICARQHWAILGPNGAGKTTLLKLILGDCHPALGGRIQRFEFTARTSLWE